MHFKKIPKTGSTDLDVRYRCDSMSDDTNTGSTGSADSSKVIGVRFGSATSERISGSEETLRQSGVQHRAQRNVSGRPASLQLSTVRGGK